MIMGRGPRRAAEVLVLALLVCACSKASKVSTPAPQPARVEDRFGPGFGTAFRADPNSAPLNPTTRDVIPVNPTGEPLPVR